VSDGIPDSYFFVAKSLELALTARSSRSWRLVGVVGGDQLTRWIPARRSPGAVQFERLRGQLLSY
jgi:hypothetical protein